MGVDLNSDVSDVKSKISSLQTYNEISQAEKQLKKSKGDLLSESIGSVSSQLNKIQEQQKRFQRNVPNSLENLVDFIGGTRGNSSSTFKYIRKKVFEALTKLEPKAQEILIGETLKALGCSQEQTYNGVTPSPLNPFQSIQTLPVSQGIYIPLNSIDFFGNLKIDPTTQAGKFFYEKETPAKDTIFKPYGGPKNFPFNKMLNLRMDSTNVGRTYGTEFSAFYNGVSEQNLLDISYETSNDLGVSGDFFRVHLIDRNGSQSNTMSLSGNTIKQFLKDYYSTIKLIDPVNVIGVLMNYASNCVDINLSLKKKQLTDNTKIEKIISRILGLCNDSRREIDVSGVAKIPELDGVDESFFEFNEADLRYIDTKLNNVQKGIITLQSCGEIELPVNVDTIMNELADFRNSVSGNTPQQTVSAMEKIVDTFLDNPSWKPIIPVGVNADIEVNKNIIRDLPKAVASGILTPKILLPIFTLLQVVEKNAKNKVNNLIQSANTQIQSGNTFLQSGTTIGQEVDNLIDDGIDFLKKFKTFCIESISKLNAEFLKILFDILKKDILNLLDTIIQDLQKSQALKKYTIYIRLIELGLIVQQLISDYRKCKSLIDDILNLFKLINNTFSNNKISKALLPFTALLPGTSPERATMNMIEVLQSIGMPTGPLPDGSPNLMNQLIMSISKGLDKEEAENGTIDAMVLVPPLTGGLLQVFGKKR
jgi:hypothetical protein